MSLSNLVVGAVAGLADIVSDLAISATITRQSSPVYDVATATNSVTEQVIQVKVFSLESTSDIGDLRLKSKADYMALADHNPGVTFMSGDLLNVNDTVVRVERVSTVSVASSIIVFELFVNN